jgi:hypothetical protein
VQCLYEIGVHDKGNRKKQKDKYYKSKKQLDLVYKE